MRPVLQLTHEECLLQLEQIRWSGQPQCPYCDSLKATRYKRKHRYHCNNCFTSYSVTTKTLFHKTHVGLDKWFHAINLVLKTQLGIGVRQLSREIKVNKNTASSMITRIYKAIQEEPKLIEKVLKIDLSGNDSA